MFADLLHRIRSYRKRRVHRRFFEGDRRAFYEKIYHGNAEPRVLTGPFRGMAYLNTSDFGPITPEWLGSYEMEIQQLVSRQCECGYAIIANIGSAEGCHSVGFARSQCRVSHIRF